MSGDPATEMGYVFFLGDILIEFGYLGEHSWTG